MFEKEAEYYAKEKYSPNTDPFIIAVADDAFKDGAEFGYNKANEWHDLRKDPKDLPLTRKEVMVFVEWKTTENETAYAYDLGTRHFNCDWCLDVFSSEDKDTKVIAWYDFPQFKE